MDIIQFVILFFWGLISFGLAFFFYKKIRLFKNLWGVLILAVLFLVFAVLHNLVYALYKEYFDSRQADEAILFLLALLSFGSGIFLLLIQLTDRIRLSIKKRKK